ncbi:hypothetical protein CALCODRAFT_492860 [Calocera cornea HHB12733]|uniref:F-box domain-containing protein n=1 Tax=Calocera cornea HHB12733 TaxID=1353952 RepID=A0A165I3M8_9BASI|nr:hypothetical protein CALCODRAFT_492860 [Calocera cornea HHB12733]
MPLARMIINSTTTTMQLILTRSAMHTLTIDVRPRASTRAFLIPELVHLILDKLDSNTLANVARIARSFHLPAASYLWNELDQLTVDNLLNLVIGAEGQANSIEDRWDRFNIYASLVRSLTLNFDEMPTAHSLHLMHSLNTLASLRISNDLLLHSLRALEFRALSVDHLSAAALFICPALERVAGNCIASTRDEWDMHIAGFLHKVQRSAPGIKEFELYAFRESNTLALSALTSLIKATRLRSFESDFMAFQPTVVHALGQSSMLTSLVLGDTGSDDDGAALERLMFSTSMQARSFVSLSSLNLETHSGVVLPLLLALRNVQLRDLSIKLVEKTFSSAVFKTLFSFIPEFASTLLSCRVDISETLEDEEDGEGTGEGTLEWTTFAPLYKCSNLTSFSCNIDSEADLDLDFGDADIQLLSQAWPDLTSLAITWVSKASSAQAIRDSRLACASGLTLASFGYLAENCARLEELEMSYIHAKAPIPCPPAGLPASSTLTDLHVGRSEIDCPITVALYLRLLWPNAVVTHSSTTETDNNSGTTDADDCRGPRWDEVNKMLFVMRYAEVVGTHTRVLSDERTLSAVVNTIRDW